MTNGRMPDMMPVLSPGRHRNPKKGACFMELASYLAGEKWSDHPSCTQALLAGLARDVNDHVSGTSRGLLVTLIPEVIGLNTTDPRADAWIAREVALAALPIVSAERQRVAAVGLIRCEEMLNEAEGRDPHALSERAQAALDLVPEARDWARGFTTLGWGGATSFSRRSAPAIVHSAVVGIAASPTSNPDQHLVNLLRDVIAMCRTAFAADAAPVAPLGDDTWRELTALTIR